ncbi:MAG: glycosyltransferase family 4 protein [Hahellaceae bacterium]|nr:glycosyltransferase family 4 protein [Hahellaceae bacterium]
MAEKGGIAHLLRTNKASAVVNGTQLLLKLRHAITQSKQFADIYHLNWLQSLLPMWNIKTPAVATILGSDYQLLNLPGVVPAIRQVLKRTNCVLAPNNEWMQQPLNNYFGDLAEVKYIPFGIDERWYRIDRQPESEKNVWICVLRLTRQKMGNIFEWGESIFKQSRFHELHLFGPNQENIAIPAWVKYHGPTTADTLESEWFPKASGLISLSQHSEGRPQVMLEAMAAGLPIIASNIPAHADLLRKDDAGILVDNEAEFLGAIEALSDHKIQLEKSLSCKKVAKESYGTWDDCYTRFNEVYTRLLE